MSELHPAIWILNVFRTIMGEGKCVQHLDTTAERDDLLNLKILNKNLDLSHWKRLTDQPGLLLWQENVSW